ncbi:MAG: hypothetical protein IZT56_15515, partial [Bacteroidetes bacterium]|nr:hypothetical protein [Bacteroidota bacterium]
EKAFYIEVDPKNGEVKIYRIKDNTPAIHFLMTLALAQKRLKQIKLLFKNDRWSLYFSENIEIVRSQLITKLVNSEKPLQALKQSLKN